MLNYWTEDDSPYPEVRAAVANTDDIDMPVSTFRAWFIGIIWAILIPGLNQFFFFRLPSVSVGGVSVENSYCSIDPHTCLSSFRSSLN